MIGDRVLMGGGGWVGRVGTVDKLERKKSYSSSVSFRESSPGKKAGDYCIVGSRSSTPMKYKAARVHLL